MTHEVLKKASLPPPEDFPNTVVMSNSKDRWGTTGQLGALPTMLNATIQVLASDHMIDSTVMLVKDGSDGPNASDLRESFIQELDKQEDRLPIFFIIPQLQEQLVEKLAQRTHLSLDIVRKIVADPGYDGRATLDAVLSAVALGNGKSIKALSLDDDTLPPQQIKTVKPEILASFGATPDPNSYILWVEKPLDSSSFDYTPNTLKGFFEPLGMTIEELTRIYPDLVVAGAWRDEMHEVMENLRTRPDVFHVTHQSQRTRNPQKEKDVRILSTTNTKTLFPDPRTKTWAEQLMLNGLVPPTGKIFSYRAGPSAPFVFYKAGFAGAVTNVDSANMGWLFSPETAYLMRWYLSNKEISKKRGLVDGQYRSENEWLTMFLVALSKKLHKRYAYFTGFDTEIEHHRAESGVRPKDPAEQAASSLYGHEASEVALSRIEFEPDGKAHLNLDGVEGYVVPRDSARSVFKEMKILRGTCADRIITLQKHLAATVDPETRILILKQIESYSDIYDSFTRRIVGNDFHAFYQKLNDEVSEQTISTDQYLRAYPIIIEELVKIIRDGDFQVLQYVPPQERNRNSLNNQVVYSHDSSPTYPA